MVALDDIAEAGLFEKRLHTRLLCQRFGHVPDMIFENVRTDSEGRG